MTDISVMEEWQDLVLKQIYLSKKPIVKTKKLENIQKTTTKSKGNTVSFKDIATTTTDTTAKTPKNYKIKSKSSCILKTINQPKNNQNTKPNLKQNSNFSTENPREKFKKNRSLDHVTKVSKTSIYKKVSVSAQRSRKSKLSLYPGVTPRITSITSPSFTLDNYCRKVNFFGCQKNAKFHTCPQSKPGKSMSYDSLNTLNGRRHLSKCLSSENGKNIETEKPIGVFNIRNKSYIQTPEAFLRKTKMNDPVWSHQTKKPRYINLQEILKNNTQTFFTKSSDNSLNKSSELQINRDSQTPENRENRWSTKNEKQTSWQNALSEKRTVKICQCLHFHTEDGFKKLCIQNNTPAKEFGNKFFRVNYFSKKEDENEEKPGKIVLIDKGTVTENEDVNTQTETSTKIKAIRKSSSISKPCSKTPNKVTWKSDKTRVPNTSPNKGKLNPQNTENKVDQKKALDELDVLEKLFLKLNSVERVLVKKKSRDDVSDRKSSKVSSKKEKQEVEGGEVDDYLSQRNKLRNAIGKHVQNLLKLDFDIS